MQLVEKKYATWEWNFGYSPAYAFEVAIELVDGFLALLIKVENGKIKQAQPVLESTNEGIKSVFNKLLGVNHKEEDIAEFAEINRPQLELAGIKIVSFTHAFFR
jgi:lipoate-protein ligase A